MLFYRVALELENIPDYYLFSETKEITGIPEEFDDITNQYLKNYKQPFNVVSYFPDSRRGILSDWLTSNAAVQYTMYDGWSDRLFMCAENWGILLPYRELFIRHSLCLQENTCL